MLEGFSDGKGVKVTPALFAVLQNAAQIMPGDFNRQRIGDDVSGLFLVLKPCGMSQSDPDGASVDNELHIHGIRMASCNRRDDALVNTTDRSTGPTLYGAEVFIHMTETVSRLMGSSQRFAAGNLQFAR